MATTDESILHVVEAYLYENFLTDEPGDFVARVGSERSLFLKEVCESAVRRGGADMSAGSLQRGTEQVLKEMAYLLCDGYSINFGYFYISLKIKGVFTGPKDTFDPARHTLHFQITPGELLRKELPNINLKVVGAKKDAAYIDLVTDTLTGATDGSITANEDILIEGARVRVAPDNGSDAETGIFFIASDGTSTAVTRRLTRNDPSKVVARVPNLPAGAYTLRVVTKYTNKKEVLKNAITIEYDRPLTIV